MCVEMLWQTLHLCQALSYDTTFNDVNIDQSFAIGFDFICFSFPQNIKKILKELNFSPRWGKETGGDMVQRQWFSDGNIAFARV